MIPVSQHICIQCNKPFYGRSDKKYCSIRCKNQYSNDKRKLPTAVMRHIHHALRHNYRILQLHFKGRATRVPKQQLIDSGFSFQFFTQDYTNSKGERYYYCYDMGYLSLEDGQILVVKNHAIAKLT